MKKFLRKTGRWMVIIYVAQALVGVSVGVYLAVTMTPEEMERIISCVAY